MTTEYTKETAHGEIDYIFKVLLPREGMAERPEQRKLSHLMFDAMVTHKIALCDAGTGIGKTYAYLVAGIIYHRYRQHNDYRWLPVVVSTSSIALQNAVLHEYLPFLSKVLMDAELIDAPVCGALRKGKTHYVCDDRLEHRLKQLVHAKARHRRQQTVQALKNDIDLDNASRLGSFDRTNVCVPAVCDCDRSHCSYPIYTMRKHHAKILSQFRQHPGAVLLATGSVWEGMDFPGDQVSLLIIPKLPFAVRNERNQRRRQEYDTLTAFIQDVVVPEMQIKLRQGFGRAIRAETDSCVIAVLDERCAEGQRYHQALMTALPEMPVTSDLGDVAEFYLDHKPTRYFKEGPAS